MTTRLRFNLIGPVHFVDKPGLNQILETYSWVLYSRKSCTKGQIHNQWCYMKYQLALRVHVDIHSAEDDTVTMNVWRGILCNTVEDAKDLASKLTTDYVPGEDTVRFEPLEITEWPWESANPSHEDMREENYKKKIVHKF